MSNTKAKYEVDLALAQHIFNYTQNQESFSADVKGFDPNALRTFTVLTLHFQSKNQDVPANLLELITPTQFYQKLNDSNSLLDREKLLSKYLVDAFEVMVNATRRLEDEHFYTELHSFLRTALHHEQPNVISVYLQILHRLNGVFHTELPIDILKTIIDAVHGPITDTKLLNEALLLVESSLEKRHNLDVEKKGANEQLLYFMWHLCSSTVTKHQCNICYTIISQLINSFLAECQSNDKFRAEFLSTELWRFIRAAIESREMIRRKQSIYILQQVLESNGKEVMSTDEFSAECGVDLPNIWKNYFAVLESLLEIQCQLILSCLEQYLGGIVKYLPPFWYSIIFALVMKHHNNVVIHYGIEFILRHGISLQHDSQLMNGFYQALNNTYLHSEAKVSEQNLAKYFQDSDMNHTLEIMILINWQPVPLWTIIKSLDVYAQLTKGEGFQVERLLEFLKRAVRVIKHLPEVDDMTVRILQNIGINKLPLEQVLGLYDVIPRKEIFDGYKQPFDLRKFEINFIQLSQISVETKINYFEHALPNIKEQTKLLDEFYEKNRTMIQYYPHYEFLLFNNLCREKSLKEALFVIKPRIYNLAKAYGNITLDGLNFSISLLWFIVDKFAADCSDTATLESINKTLTIFHEVLRKKQYLDNNSSVETQIYKQISAIQMKMTRCVQLYPNKFAVVGVLSDVISFEDDKIDLSRFDPNDENEGIQGLYDCFMDKCYEFKQSHQANIIYKMLSKFNHLEFDAWKAYRTLLAGKANVDCIFRQTHPYCASKMNEILADAIIHGNELKGEDKQTYDFVNSKTGSITYNQKVRLSAMRAIAENNNLEQIRSIKNLLFARNTEIYRVRYYTNSYHHSMKLRITQALAFLFRFDPIWDDRMLRIILDEANQPNVTHINELIIAETIDRAQMLEMIRDIDGNKGMQSMFMIVYYVCCKSPTDVQFARECVEFIIKYIFVKQIIVRSSAQIFLIKLCEKFDLISDFEILYDSAKAAHEFKFSRALKLAHAYKYRFDQIQPKQMLNTIYTLREIPRITKMLSDEYYKHEIYDADDASLAIQMDEDESLTSQESVDVEMGFIENNEETFIASSCNGGGNVQRKLVTYRETLIDRQVLNSLSDEFTRRDTKTESELIILGSLLTKASNLGGLSRSAEVFGVHAVALDNLKHLKHNDFTSISMAAEKWLKYFEVKHYYVVKYLMAMKADGYSIVGAEQTAYGGELHKVQMPKKMVLVLGHEKDGIPADILNLLDMAIEVPQFGVVRSLNVHVTASLFMWEYAKQHLIVDSDTSRQSILK